MIANLSHRESPIASSANDETDSVDARNPLSQWEMLASLANGLERDGVEWAILGDTEHLPADLDSDVDLVIGSGQFSAFEKVIRSLVETHNGRLVQAIQHEQTSWFYIIAWPDSTGVPQYLQLDVCTDYFRSGRRLLESRFLLSGASTVEINSATFRVPGPVSAFVYYLIKKAEKNSISGSHEELLSGWWQAMTQPQRLEATAFFGALNPDDIEEMFANRSFSENLSRIKTNFQRPRAKFADAVREYRRLANRVLRPNGLFVVMMGPDGSGKTTINTLARKYTSTAFWGERYFHFRPFTVSGDDEQNVVTDPHAEPPRGAVSSIAKLTYYLTDYVAGYFLKIRPVLARTGLVIFDRYFPDMQVDTVRYRYGGPRWLLNLVGNMIPEPDLYVFLDVDAATILTRKQEVTPEECERQVEAYRQSANQLDNAVLVDASRQPEAVAADAAWSMLNSLADKTDRRLK